MQDVRIVSLLPSATEILCALGAGADLVGVTDECNYPERVVGLPKVSRAALPTNLSSTEIDEWVSRARHEGQDLYHLDADLIADLDPDLIVTQALCDVCAPASSRVAAIAGEATVLTLDPHTLHDVIGTFTTLGAACHREAAAADLAGKFRRRLAASWRAGLGYQPPRVALLEWTDPPFAPGHWIPEMVELAGGNNVLGQAGERSVRTAWSEVRAAAPDLVICAPCGFDLDNAAALAADLPDLGVPVWAVDADASFARPGPRLIEGIEALVSIINPHRTPTDQARRVR